jgi:hypothetical protein
MMSLLGFPDASWSVHAFLTTDSTDFTDGLLERHDYAFGSGAAA